jgi:hypothetical protein
MELAELAVVELLLQDQRVMHLVVTVHLVL